MLLKNDSKTLPLRPEALGGKNIAVLGLNALLCTPGGGGSASMNPQYQGHPFDALKTTLADLKAEVNLRHTAGAVSHKWLPLTSDDQWSTDTKLSNKSAMLRVEFFATDDPTGPVTETQYRNSSSVDLTDSGPACLREAGKPYSLRVSSTVRPQKTGRHEFRICSVGNSRLRVNDNILLDNFDWSEPGDAFYAFSSAEIRETMHMVAGESYEVVVEAVSRVPDTPEGAATAQVWGMQPSVRLGYLEEQSPNMMEDAVVTQCSPMTNQPHSVTLIPCSPNACYSGLICAGNYYSRMVASSVPKFEHKL